MSDQGPPDRQDMADMVARFVPGDRVVARAIDPDHHIRLPRYVRGHVGEVVEVQGAWPLPDDRAQRRPAPWVEPVYTVRFAAADLWGEGGHEVTVDLWQSYLEPAPYAAESAAAAGPNGPTVER